MTLYFTPSGVLFRGALQQTELLFHLVREPVNAQTPPEVRFFHETFRNFLCRMLRREPDFASALPSPEELTRLAESAPPVRGGCSPAHLERLFRDVLQEVLTHTPVRSFLAELVPAWKDVGRVTFHLAENRRDADGKHPFVFLATYPDGVGESGNVRHIPLASALKHYAADKAALCALLQPVRAAAEKSPFLSAMFENKSLFKPCVWSPHEAFLFVREIPVFQTAGIPVRLNQGATRRPARLKLDITVETMPAPRKGIPITESILRFSAAVSLGGKTLSEEELAAIMKTGGGLIRVRGEWVEADTLQIEKLLEQWRRADRLSESAGIPFLQGLHLVAGVRKPLAPAAAGNVPLPPDPDDLCEIHAGPAFADLLSGARNLPVPPLPERLPLRPYQIQGVRWLYRMGELGLGGCLADDMGLGKTLQILSYLEMLRARGDLARGPGALAVVPASLLENWRAESGKFTPELRTVILHPSEGNVSAFRADPEAFFRLADLTVTSYSMAVRLPELAPICFDALFLDEAQNIKNPSCRQSGAIRKLRAKRKFALTGTPLENSISDLWSIFDFLVPDLLGSFSAFRDWLHSMESDTENGYAPLRKTVRPFILRRLKTDRSIIQDLPDKSEVKVRCALTEVQAKMYARAVEMLRAELFSAEENRRSAVILGYLTQFKQICNHPTQFSGLGEYTVERSGKFQSLAALAETISLRGDKLLVFTQFREIIQPLHDMLADIFRRPGLTLHGGTSVPERAESVRAFQSEQGPPFFVLSLRAAGVGLNLTAANHVVHFDRWWNPAVENQATDRAYRIGQHRNVLVHKFVCRGTLEERIDAMIDGKRKLADTLLSGGAEKLLTDMSNEELLDFVRGGQ